MREDLKSKLAMLILRMVIPNVQSDTEYLSYSLNDFINVIRIIGKPSSIKNRIIEALGEITKGENPLIISYEVNDSQTNYRLKVNSSVIFNNLKNSNIENILIEVGLMQKA